MDSPRMSCDGSPRPVPVLLPTSVTWSPYINDVTLACEDFPLLQDTARFAGTSPLQMMNPQQIVSFDLVRFAYPTPKGGKKMQAFAGIWGL